MPIAEIIAIGTELLLGEIPDTNTQYIARTMRELGINLFRTTVVGDNKDRIAALVREAMGRSEIIITTGGLGPTVDDPTREALAQATDSDLMFHPELWESISKRFIKAGRTPGDNQKRQAYIPHNAIIINNPVGTAPAFIIITEKNAVISLPGVPAEMKTLLDISVIPFLQQHYNLKETLKVRTLHTSGAGEGWIDERISDLETLVNPTVGLAAHSGMVDIRITARAANEIEAEKLIINLETEIRNRLGDFIYGSDKATLEETALDASAQCGWKVFCVEAGTAGLLNQRLSTLQNPTYLGGCQLPDNTNSLHENVEVFRKDGKADVVLGLSVTLKDNSSLIHLVILAPEKDYDHQVNYIGHPDNAPILGVNLMLDRLRRLKGIEPTSK
ncbi:MAG: hypothetical protein A2X25_13600 [Chloroflexi bacterium GWB2_49_20]|nr:MAG: hypothetical protein A2X25_13600 [Chloroflexi bacterium GWB2_49_20]OGN79983.1 MAG: hypothetical protein A2X26_03150 [Chloroflexi bacterium GWC2_49_37]OGN85481.1 MAG: hypothetical protein A2X27_03910 [Chloroflexi bacterium GWD2_49_16]HBG74349.1 competence/damage-inducible protein A [Anaerolineae bacterium]HCM97041.1 competence/damage-inducible protein A [Anaerolineae bacterium]